MAGITITDPSAFSMQEEQEKKLLQDFSGFKINRKVFI
jgi:hypothetical protein